MIRSIITRVLARVALMHRILIASLMFMPLVPASASAARLCATNSAELQAALDVAANNNQADQIRIAIGTYTAPAGGFSYDAQSIDGDQQAIAIAGGWNRPVLLFEACEFTIGHGEPSRTILDGHGDERVLELRVRSQTDVDVRSLTFMNGRAINGAGLWIWHDPANFHQGDVRIERNAFLFNTATSGGGLQSTDSAGAMYLINNLFFGNESEDNFSAAVVAREGTSGGGIFVVNNTILDNLSGTVATPTEMAVVGLYAHFLPTTVWVINNNFWGNGTNGGADLRVYNNEGGTGSYRLTSNNFETRVGDEPTTMEGNIHVEPEYQSGDMNFTPVRGSPLVDAGVELIGDFMTDHDLDGSPRVVGPAVDIGAYENERIFSGGFEVP